MPGQHDVVVIGAGPNGLVAANVLADHGLSVLVLEAQPGPGGAVRSAQATLPGFEHDLFSAFHPFAVASPAIRDLRLEEHGLSWLRSPVAVAHPTPGGRAALLCTDIDATAASLDAFAPGDGRRWRELHALWRRVEEPFMDALTTPFPPLRAGGRLAAALGPRGSAELARMALLSARRLAGERFRGEGAALLLAGNALHADLTPDTALGGAFGWILCSLGQRHGFPVPAGGSGRLTEALVRRLRARGGEVRCASRVARVTIRRRRAVGVRLESGEDVAARRGVIADAGAPRLYLELVGREHLSARVVAALRSFQYDDSTIKVDWALRSPIPWTDPSVRAAGTIHVGDDLDMLTAATTDLARQVIPARPFLIMGQYAATDASRAPEGAETAWAYTHVPQHARADARGELTGRWDRGELERFAERIEDEVERLAPGFRDTILARHIQGPHELEAADENLVGGAINGGTARIHQQAILRPIPGLGRPETPIRGLYLGSASAHPGGGVHGAPGANAARALLAHLRLAPPGRRP